jgi:hypothetical protein
MTAAQEAAQRVQRKLDKALATTLATQQAEDRYFIGEAILTAITFFLLNRYAGAYVDRLGLKPLAESHADKTKAYLDRIRAKEIAPSDTFEQEQLLQESILTIRKLGWEQDAEQAANRALILELTQAGALRAQATATVAELSAALNEAVRKSDG